MGYYRDYFVWFTHVLLDGLFTILRKRFQYMDLYSVNYDYPYILLLMKKREQSHLLMLVF